MNTKPIWCEEARTLARLICVKSDAGDCSESMIAEMIHETLNKERQAKEAAEAGAAELRESCYSLLGELTAQMNLQADNAASSIATMLDNTDIGEAFLARHKRMEEALRAAHLDLMQWKQLAQNYRTAIGAEADYTPYCASLNGIATTEKVMVKIGLVLREEAL